MSAFRDSIDVPAETKFQDDALLKMQSHIPDLVNTWREECKAAILKIITDGLGSLPNSVDPLSLAVATLDCVFCSYKGLRWPQVLAHRCLRGRRNLDPDAAAKNPYRQAVLIARDRLETWYMWDSEAFVFNPSLKRTRAVIEACGKDPDTATYEEMESCGVRVFCSDCLRHCEALDWKMAVGPLSLRSCCPHSYRRGHRSVTKPAALRPSSCSMRRTQPRLSSWKHSSGRSLRTHDSETQIPSMAAVIVTTGTTGSISPGTARCESLLPRLTYQLVAALTMASGSI